jgi:hypothetical protein
MSATRRFLVGFVVAFCLATAGTASAYHTRFIQVGLFGKKTRELHPGRAPINKECRSVTWVCGLNAAARPPPSHPTPLADSRVSSRAGR